MSNHDLMETSPVHPRARGGTELLKHRLYDGTVPRRFLERFQILFSHEADLDSKRLPIFYAHNPAEGAEHLRLTDPAYRRQFAKFVFVSHWQMQEYNEKRGVAYQQSVVIKNSIEPIDISARTNSGKIRLIYHTMPDRGLNILVPVFVELAKLYPDLELHVYSSFELYGWGQRDVHYQPIFDVCKSHPQIRYHGAVSNEEVRRALVQSDIFAYPSTMRETSSLCLIEAMSAGLLCVHPNLGALPETSMGLTGMYQWQEGIDAHAAEFFGVLRQGIDQLRHHRAALSGALQLQKSLADRVHNWRDRAGEWTRLLEYLLEEHEAASRPRR
jgi:glycosyltransferase involved in cell wall biosynthesis